MAFDLDKIKFDAQGLVPAVVQDAKTNAVVMLAYMNRESLKLTLETGYTWFWSRSRQELWNKGATSGNMQQVKDIYYDCDGDTLLVIVHQQGSGACHTGTYSCFSGRNLLPKDKELAVVEQQPESWQLAGILRELYDVIKDRQINPKEGSYTNYLFEKGQDKILKKVGEEAVETVIASKNMDKSEVVYEMGDLWYHCLVLLAYHNIKPEAIFEELIKRHNGGDYHKFTGKNGIRPAD